MHRTQILLDPRQHDHLVRKAQQLQVSLSALVRQLVAKDMAEEAPIDDPLEQLFGIGRGLGDDAARNHDRILYDELQR